MYKVYGEKVYKVYDDAYTKCTKCTMESSLSVQRNNKKVYKVYKVYDETYTKCKKCTVKKCTKCTKCTMKLTLSVQSVRQKSVQGVQSVR